MMFRQLTKAVGLAIAVAAASATISTTASACACCGTYQVTNVASDDDLNMRSGPGVNFSNVGSIPSGSACVIKSGPCDGKWCRVSYAATKGWVNTNYLRYMARP